MEELEDPTERLKETMEAAEEKKERWTMHVALSTAIIAVLAAIAGLYGNHHANEAMLDQIKSSDQWAYYQSKSIKAEIAASTAQVLDAIGKSSPKEGEDKKKKYEDDKAEIKAKAEEAEKSSESHMQQHVVLSRAVMIFQIAVALSAVAILTRQKLVWYGSMLLAAAGCVFLVLGFLAG
jgi:heme/copper-type cytochrome/quinol oxidase subunit 4